MKSSGNSSAKANPTAASQPPSGRPSRKAFALTGRSVALDPRTHAVRGDLADVRLAEQVFAPHYAAPMPAIAIRDVAIFAERGLVERIADLATGDSFEVLELAGNHAWGLATAQNVVGYVERAALDRAGDRAGDHGGAPA